MLKFKPVFWASSSAWRSNQAERQRQEKSSASGVCLSCDHTTKNVVECSNHGDGVMGTFTTKKAVEIELNRCSALVGGSTGLHEMCCVLF